MAPSPGTAEDEFERCLTERTAQLREALDRQTMLLREAGHRVATNLQVIASLMVLKARRTQEGEARLALEGMADRIGALAVAHRLVGTEDSLARFALAELAEGLIGEIGAGLADDRVRLATEIGMVALPAAMASPLALTIQELLSNAVRHAYPGDRQGEVRVLGRLVDDALHLEIRDDGIGIDATAVNRQGFGRSLVEMIARQVGGTVAWSDAEPGTRVVLTIPVAPGA
ncbi:sensor histidine kinase [Methylobacterium aerolatum]|uniref:histidine kinase n=1 Tax=Methylobacterium aerolatum TaxID=418708 RepID=A0ABU0HYG4_9HYPH|nr:sensor histidine kinase [Methylobacterium aerolatum]MDQ0447384.1 two-component sensor histidine kinase [Methylobacterium aerolatum]GJD34135.1 putative sensor histidine kinase pdtaS [Methylobacterium aerolatum]